MEYDEVSRVVTRYVIQMGDPDTHQRHLQRIDGYRHVHNAINKAGILTSNRHLIPATTIDEWTKSTIEACKTLKIESCEDALN